MELISAKNVGLVVIFSGAMAGIPKQLLELSQRIEAAEERVWRVRALAARLTPEFEDNCQARELLRVMQGNLQQLYLHRSNLRRHLWANRSALGASRSRTPQDLWHEQLLFVKEMLDDCGSASDRLMTALVSSSKSDRSIPAPYFPVTMNQATSECESDRSQRGTDV
jgi:hypothetical protein